MFVVVATEGLVVVISPFPSLCEVLPPEGEGKLVAGYECV